MNQKTQYYDNPNLPYNATEASIKNIDQILEKGAWKLYEKYLWDKCPKYYAQDIYNDGVIGQQAIPFDKGESKVQLSHKWVPEKEPIGIDMDHNARNSVKIQYKASQQPDSNLDDTQSNRSSLLSISNRSSLVGKGKFSSFGSQLKSIKNISTLSNKSNNAKEEENRKNTVPELNYELVELDYDIPPTPDSDIERMRDVREKKEKINNIKKIADNKKKEEEQIFEERKNALIKNLKNRKYTYEYDGQIVYIKNQPRFGEKDIKDQPLEQEGLQYKNPNKTSGEVTKVALNVKPQPVKLVEEFKKKKKEDTQIFKTEEFNKQPNQHEFVKPRPGVHIQFPNGVKKDGEKIEQENRMKKEVYQKMIEDLPNRPVPTYNLQKNKQDNQDLPKLSEFETELRRKIGNIAQGRPLTASNLQQINEFGQFRPNFSKMTIVEKEKFIQMMSEEQPLNKLTQGSKAGSFISLKRTESEVEAPTVENQKSQQVIDPKAQAQKHVFNKDFDRIKTFKKKEQGPKGSIEVSYDIGIQISKQLKKEVIENDSKIHKKVDKFNRKQIIESDMWGQDVPSLNHREQPHPYYKKLHSNVTRVQSAKNLNRIQSGQIMPASTKNTRSTQPTEGNNIRIHTAKSMKNHTKSTLNTKS